MFLFTDLLHTWINRNILKPLLLTPSLKSRFNVSRHGYQMTQVIVKGSHKDKRQVFLSSSFLNFPALNLSLSLPHLCDQLLFPFGQLFKRAVFPQVICSTFVCSDLTKECVAFARPCLGRMVKTREEGGKRKRKLQNCRAE